MLVDFLTAVGCRQPEMTFAVRWRGACTLIATSAPRARLWGAQSLVLVCQFWGGELWDAVSLVLLS